MQYYIISVIRPILRVSTLQDGWFNFEGGKVKTDNFKPLAKKRVAHKENPEIKGIMSDYGISGTPFVYVYWTNLPLKGAWPTAFVNINDLIFI